LENGPLKLVLSEIVSSFEADQSKKFRCTIDLFYRIAGAFILSQRQTFQCFKRMHAAKSSTRDELFRRMLAAREYMNDLWSSPVTIEELARAVFMSPFHFHRTFTTTFAITPAQYLKKIRMQKAKELMRLNCTISEVAVKVGYDDIFSFSKAFKKMFGLPPSHPQALQDS
jgi:AraC-like DNA-binding protein